VRVNDLTIKLADTNDAITRLAEETQIKIDRLAEQDRRLGERIDALVSAIGIFLSKQNPTPQS
jgi:hypothetical protein